MTDAEIKKFLEKPRLAYLTTLRKSGAPFTVPLWFEWDGSVVRMFAGADSPKIKRIRREPRVCVTVGNNLDEYECWVSFEGTVAITEGTGRDLALRLAKVYWDMSDPARKKAYKDWGRGRGCPLLPDGAPTGPDQVLRAGYLSRFAARDAAPREALP